MLQANQEAHWGSDVSLLSVALTILHGKDILKATLQVLLVLSPSVWI